MIGVNFGGCVYGPVYPNSQTHETVEQVLDVMRSLGNYQSFSGDYARQLAHRMTEAIKYERKEQKMKALVMIRDTVLGVLGIAAAVACLYLLVWQTPNQSSAQAEMAEVE